MKISEKMCYQIRGLRRGEQNIMDGISWLQVDGTPDDMNVFNGNYDAASGRVTYGGFIFHGNRIAWDRVSPDMVQVDANGKQTFVAGDYTYIDATTGYSFNITCKDGDTVPQMTRNIQISAGESGIFVDGKRFEWSELKNEEGEGLTSYNVNSGTWTLNYEGADISFFVGSEVKSVQDMADAINACREGKVRYTLHTEYVGPVPEQAVDAEAAIKNLNISNAFAQYITTNSGVNIIVRAGDGTNGTKNGIWLEQQDGTEIANSVRNYLSYVLQKKRTAARAGQDPDLIRLDPPTLTELVGTGNITNSGYFDQVLKIDDAAMHKTDGETT